MPVQTLKRGAIPSPRSALLAAVPHAPVVGAPPNFITLPAQISMWGNDIHGDCVTAEEAFAKACNDPEIFIPEEDAIAWAKSHGVLEGAVISQVLEWMQSDGFRERAATYDDGPYFSVDFSNAAVLRSAIATGPVKIGVAADQLETAWRSTNGQSGWFATGFNADNNEDHCVSLCGYGSVSWLAQQMKVEVPAGIDGGRNGYALFTWNSIGIIDESSLSAITHEAWVRKPTTIAKPSFPDWQLLDQNPDTVDIVSDGTTLYQLHKTGKIWKYVGPPVTGWQELDNNSATKQIVASKGQLYQLHETGKIWKYTGTPMTGWEELDDNPASVAIAAADGELFQLHSSGRIWRYSGTPMSGWQELDNNPATAQIVASGEHLYQMHSNGEIWQYVGPPMTGWQQLDNNPASVALAADGNALFQLHNTGNVWKYVGPPMTGWQQLDNNPATKRIAAAGGQFFQQHDTGKIWKYVGPPMTGWTQLDDNVDSRAILAAGPHLYQLHKSGKIWLYTGA